MVTAKVEDDLDSKPKEKVAATKRQTKVRVFVSCCGSTIGFVTAAVASGANPLLLCSYCSRLLAEKAQGQAKASLKCLQFLLQGRERKDSQSCPGRRPDESPGRSGGG